MRASAGYTLWLCTILFRVFTKINSIQFTVTSICNKVVHTILLYLNFVFSKSCLDYPKFLIYRFGSTEFYYTNKIIPTVSIKTGNTAILPCTLPNRQLQNNIFCETIYITSFFLCLYVNLQNLHVLHKIPCIFSSSYSIKHIEIICLNPFFSFNLSRSVVICHGQVYDQAWYRLWTLN